MKFEVAALVISMMTGFSSADESVWKPVVSPTGPLNAIVEGAKEDFCWATKMAQQDTSTSQGQMPQYC